MRSIEVNKELLSPRIPVMRNQAVIGLCVFIFALSLAWQLGGKIVANDMNSIAFVALASRRLRCCNQDFERLASRFLFFPHLASVRGSSPQISRQQHGDLFRVRTCWLD